MADTSRFRFDPGPLALDVIAQLTAAMWSDLAFDQSALAALKRDGLALDGVRLTGPCPYGFATLDGREIELSLAPTITDPHQIGLLIDLWQVHFMRGLRPGAIAA